MIILGVLLLAAVAVGAVLGGLVGWFVALNAAAGRIASARSTARLAGERADAAERERQALHDTKLAEAVSRGLVVKPAPITTSDPCQCGHKQAFHSTMGGCFRGSCYCMRFIREGA